MPRTIPDSMIDFAIPHPVQIPRRRRSGWAIELWAAVLELGIRDYLLRSYTDPGYEKPDTRESWAWIHSPRQTIGSFRWCCELLGLDHGAVVSAIEARADKPRGLRMLHSGLRSAG